MSGSVGTTNVVLDSVTSRLGCFVELTKPRLSLLVLFSVAAAGFAATGESTSIWLILVTVIGTGLIAASATIGNQIVELDIDSRMARTSGRPLPSGRVSAQEATHMMVATGVSGLAILGLAVNSKAAWFGFVTWVLYVLIYTPIKQRSSWNTVVGAIPGAMPVLIGWSATGAPIDQRCATLFAILFFWQFPHFMAIAWLFREDYRQGGLRMLTVTEPSGRFAGWLAVGMAIAVLVASLWPLWHATFDQPAVWAYAMAAAGLGLWQLGLSFQFLRDRHDANASRLLRASLIYLPLLLSFFSFLPR